MEFAGLPRFGRWTFLPLGLCLLLVDCSGERFSLPGDYCLVSHDAFWDLCTREDRPHAYVVVIPEVVEIGVVDHWIVGRTWELPVKPDKSRGDLEMHYWEGGGRIFRHRHEDRQNDQRTGGGNVPQLPSFTGHRLLAEAV
jgi:hypothetical protein